MSREMMFRQMNCQVVRFFFPLYINNFDDSNMREKMQHATYLGNHHKKESLISGKVRFHGKKAKVFEDTQNKFEKQTRRENCDFCQG